MSIWDIVLAGAITGLCPALVGGIIDNYRHKRGWTPSSSAITTAMLYIIAVALWQLQAPFSAVISFVEAVLWNVIMVQSYKWRPAKASNTPKVLEK